jgi:hypothetical protein
VRSPPLLAVNRPQKTSRAGCLRRLKQAAEKQQFEYPGLKRPRENSCRPCGTRFLYTFTPHLRAGLIDAVASRLGFTRYAPPFVRGFSSHAHTEALIELGPYRSAESAAPPKTGVFPQPVKAAAQLWCGLKPHPFKAQQIRINQRKVRGCMGNLERSVRDLPPPISIPAL